MGSAYEDEQRAKEVTRDHLIAAERKAHSVQNALEEARTLLEQSDRARRLVEQELSDTNESLSELTCQNQAIAGAKRKLDSELQTIHGDLDEMGNELGLSDDKAKDTQARLDDAEANALKGGKKAMNKMETRIRELQSELDAESRRFADAAKNLRRSERRIKELSFAGDEDRKNHERMQGLIDGLQGKIKSYKKQIEEAEEIAALNLAKFRQAQTNLADAEERADINDQALGKLKAKLRASVGPM